MFLVTPGYAINVDKAKDCRVVLILDSKTKARHIKRQSLHQDKTKIESEGETRSAASPQLSAKCSNNQQDSLNDRLIDSQITTSKLSYPPDIQSPPVLDENPKLDLEKSAELDCVVTEDPSLIHRDVFIDGQLNVPTEVVVQSDLTSEGVVVNTNNHNCLYGYGPDSNNDLEKPVDNMQTQSLEVLNTDDTEVWSNTLFVASEEEVVSGPLKLDDVADNFSNCPPGALSAAISFSKRQTRVFPAITTTGAQVTLTSSDMHQQKLVVCESCGTTLDSVETARVHILSCQSAFDGSSSSVTGSSSRPIQFRRCQYCGLLTTNRKVHMKRVHFAHHRAAWRRQADQYTCCQCPYTTSQLTSIRNHVDARHAASDEKVHRCTICNTAYKTINSLRAHKSRVHTKKTREKLTADATVHSS